MGHISPGGDNLLDFLELQQELSTYDLDLRDPLCWPHERSVPMQVARGTLHRKRERNSSVVPPFPEFHRCLSPFQGNLFSLHCLDFQAEDRLTPRWLVGQPCGKASWESLVGKPRGRASRESHRSLHKAKGSVTLLLQLGRKAHVHAPTRDED